MNYRICLSFKKTKRDLLLLNEVNKQEDKSIFIKNAIEFYLKNKDKVFLKHSIKNQEDINNKENEISKSNKNIKAALSFMKV